MRLHNNNEERSIINTIMRCVMHAFSMRCIFMGDISVAVPLSPRFKRALHKWMTMTMTMGEIIIIVIIRCVYVRIAHLSLYS